MKMTRSGVAMCLTMLLLLLHGSRDVECRRHRERRRDKDVYTLLVFGDSFVDVGNHVKSDLSRASRGWYKPYGSHDSAHGNAPTGRLSDGLVQSDYLAKMLGGDESPPPYRLLRGDASDGVNFALPFSGALNSGDGQLSLSGQIGQLRRLLNRGTIEDTDLEESVALVSASNSHDYADANDRSSTNDMDAHIRDVVDEIVDAVERLLDLGVSKVMVNSLPPVGCSPWRSFDGSSYARCDSIANGIATTHNTLLKQKLGELQGDVLMLDLYTAFNDAARSTSGSTPCCDASAKGYCGEEDASGTAQYTVCDSPSRHFYWDYVHPTQAGWKAVMDQLQPTIQDFLGIQ